VIGHGEWYDGDVELDEKLMINYPLFLWLLLVFFQLRYYSRW